MCYIECINTGDTAGGNGAVNLDYKSGECLHEQIKNEIKRHIINGILEMNEQLPSVRDLSLSLTVNPNTVQRAYKALEQEGFIYSIQGKGSFVAEISRDTGGVLFLEKYNEFCHALRELVYLGAEKEMISDTVNKIFDERADKK